MGDRMPTKAHEYLFLLAKSERYYYDADAIREPFATDDRRPPMGPSQLRHGKPFPAQGARSGWKQPAGWAGDGLHTAVAHNVEARRKTRRDPNARGRRQAPEPVLGRNVRSVWTIATRPLAAAHFATFPEELVERCVLAGAPEGATVLDPFVGSGTTAMVAARLGRNAIGIDLNPEYVAMAERRVAPYRDQAKLDLTGAWADG